ncbi:hypothetical protein [Dyella sp. SG609]|nr:hypothetical protein [Dyella sp. SG609]NKJ21990.1 hypothetical protein [Dyella sp. SG609]
MITDQGKDDPIPFELGSWDPVAKKAAEYIKQLHGREELTEVKEAA